MTPVTPAPAREPMSKERREGDFARQRASEAGMFSNPWRGLLRILVEPAPHRCCLGRCRVVPDAGPAGEAVRVDAVDGRHHPRRCLVSAPVWHEGDPQPDGVTAVVDDDGVVWTLQPEDDEDDGYAGFWLCRAVATVGIGAWIGPPIGVDWDDLWSYVPKDSSLREATADELDTFRIELGGTS